jgi:glycosyltransferase involved in cell wall biosynthesis
MPVEKTNNHFFEKLSIIMIARFEHPKRQDLLIEAAKEIDDVDIVLVGNHEGMDLGDLPNNVLLYGENDNLSKLFEKSNVFALLSESEGMPLSVLEAMSYGRALLLSNIKSMREFIDNNGMLTNNDIASVVETINVLKKENIKKFGEESEKIFDKKYNLILRKEEYIHFYENIIGR